ncbi:hypothetical protein FJR11_22855 [Anabaena sp. UHCC 0187]|uniref:hypothetical protein n=2 Tax=unclassified Anabaena TaxID=2619674 RepID=UPI001447DA49|nr:hypothetical protein [Anabaena sp. UHCC 0187]MTJ15350.1 hypothetical protein [Anabaena sp. UHCC 0187]
MFQNSYSDTVAQLFNYQEGTGKLSPDKWPNYDELGITTEHIPELIRLATDEDFYTIHHNDLLYYESGLLEYAPIHAIRILGKFRVEEAIEPLITLLSKFDKFDFKDEILFILDEELKNVLSLIGLPVIPALSTYIADDSHGQFSRIIAILTIKTIASIYPEYYQYCVTSLCQQLESFRDNDPEFNGHIVWVLSDMNAIDCLPLIERAFQAGCVDEDVIGDYDEVLVKLGLKDITDISPKTIKATGTENPISLNFTTSPRFKQLEKLNKAQQKRDARRKRNLNQLGK